jgi:hypothetical protein
LGASRRQRFQYPAWVSSESSKDNQSASSGVTRSEQWNEVRSSFATGGLSIDAIIETSIRADNLQISKAAAAIEQVIESLRKLAARAA